MVSSLYLLSRTSRLITKKGSFKPYFRWSAPYTLNEGIMNLGYWASVLNLILDGQLLILNKHLRDKEIKIDVLNLILDGQLLIQEVK